MRICQNRPLDKFMRFLFMRYSALYIVMYGAIKICGTNLCDLHLTRIIHINLMQKFVPLRYVNEI